MTAFSIVPQEDGPNNVDAEQQVLGAILYTPNALPVVQSHGGERLFYDPVHAAIYRAALTLDKAGKDVSPVTLKVWADSDPGMADLGGSRYLVRLAGASITSGLSSYCEILADLAGKRDLIDAMDAARMAIRQGEEDAAVIAGRLEASLVAQDATTGPKPTSMMAATTLAVEQAWSAYTGEDSGAVQSGIASLDRIIGGFYPGEMTILGGRPSMGKTAVALSIGLNVARAGHGVVICSFEMNPEAMAFRALAEQTSRQGEAVSYAGMRRGDMSPRQVESMKQAAQEVAGLPITFLSRHFADIGALFAGAKQARRMLGDNMRLLIVDYAQLMRSDARSRYEQITEISMALKALSGQLNVPILALSQLSRGIESREEKRPMLSDLRESGQLEQDADAVMFCYRDEYYLEREEPDLSDSEAHADWRTAMAAARHRLEIIVAKQRQGEIATARVRCNPAQNLIWED